MTELDSEIEKLRSDLHTALVTRDQYFIQLGDARREIAQLQDALKSMKGRGDHYEAEVERLRAAIESVREENRVDRWRAEIEDICARVLKTGREG